MRFLEFLHVLRLGIYVVVFLIAAAIIAIVFGIAVILHIAIDTNLQSKRY